MTEELKLGLGVAVRSELNLMSQVERQLIHFWGVNGRSERYGSSHS